MAAPALPPQLPAESGPIGAVRQPSPSTAAEAAARALAAPPVDSPVHSGFVGDWLSAPDGGADPETLSWWAAGLLSAVATADTTETGEPLLAAAGHAATAALLLLQHRDGGDDAEQTRARLLEVYGVISDQAALVRELLQDTAPAVPAPTTAHRPRRRRRRFSFPVAVPGRS